LKNFKLISTKHPTSSLAHYGYALSLARSNNRKEAIRLFRKALEAGGSDPYVMKDLGRLYFLEGDYSRALNILKAAHQLDGDNPDVNFHMGLIYMDLGELEKAIKYFERTVLKYPEYDQAVYSLGQAYGRQGQLGKAHYYLGIFYHQKGQLKNAVFHLNRARMKIDDPDKMRKIEKMLEATKAKKNNTR
jgi:predicted Zn-dependent protease